MLSIRPLAPALGAEIQGLDLSRPLDEPTFARVRDAFHDRSVILFRGQRLTEDQHIAFSRRFGPLEIHVATQYLLPSHPEIVVLSNLVEDGKPKGIEDAGRYWHSDLSYMRRPSLGSLLYALEVPAEGGDTLFASMVAAYEALPADLKRRIAGLQAIHRYGDRWRKDAEEGRARSALTKSDQAATLPDAIHPVVCIHPANGRPALYVNEGFTVGIVGMAEAEARALLDELFAFSTQAAFSYRHRWRRGDLLFWDNRSVVHSATPYDPGAVRHMHRTTVAGDATA